MLSESGSNPSSFSSSLSPTSMKFTPSVSDTLLITSQNSKIFTLFVDYFETINPIIAYQSDFQEDKTQFLNFLVKIKIPTSSDPFNVLIFQHAFDKIYFSAFFFSVPDIYALNFTRKIALVLGHQDRNYLLSAVQKFKGEILKIIQKIQYTAFDIFKQDNPSNQTEEIQNIYKAFTSEVDFIKAEVSGDVSLRSLSDYVNLPEYSKIIQQTIDTAPKSQLLCNIQSRCELPTTGSVFKFGNYQNLYEFMSYVQSPDVNNAAIHMLDLVDSDTLYHSIFSILAGKTLIIKSADNYNEAISLGRRFTSFVPFFRESYFITKQSLSVAESLQYSIAVVSSFPSETKGSVSLIDLDKKMYKGESCPHKSFVWTELQKEAKFNESTFLVVCYREIVKISGRLTSFLSTAKFENRENALNSLESAGFSKDDEPIFKYWLHCAANKQNSRPILPNNRSKLGIVMTAL